MDPGGHTGAQSGRSPCLIVGCGYVGTRLARRLATECVVRAIVRSDARAAALGALGIEPLQVDLDAGGAGMASLPAMAAEAAVFYLTPPPHTNTSDPRIARFLTALGTTRPRVLVYASTTGVYGDTGGAVVSERAELAPATDRARRRVAAERIAIDWCAARRVRCVILRVPGIYGPERLPLERLRRGEPVLKPQDAGPGNRIHVDDLVSACIAALACGASGVFNVTDGDHATTSEFLIATASLAGLPPPPLVTRDEARTQVSPGMLSFLDETRRVDNTRMRDVLRVPLKYPDMRSGIAASLEEMRANPRP